MIIEIFSEKERFGHLIKPYSGKLTFDSKGQFLEIVEWDIWSPEPPQLRYPIISQPFWKIILNLDSIFLLHFYLIGLVYVS